MKTKIIWNEWIVSGTRHRAHTDDASVTHFQKFWKVAGHRGKWIAVEDYDAKIALIKDQYNQGE